MRTPNLAQIWRWLGGRPPAPRSPIPTSAHRALAEALNLPGHTTYAELIISPHECVKLNITRFLTNAELRSLQKLFAQDLTTHLVEKEETYIVIDGEPTPIPQPTPPEP